MADYDIPAMINFALKITGQDQLFYIGHSQGTLVGFLSFSEHPEVASKVKLFIALAPIYHLNHTDALVRDAAFTLGPIQVRIHSPYRRIDYTGYKSISLQHVSYRLWMSYQEKVSYSGREGREGKETEWDRIKLSYGTTLLRCVFSFNVFPLHSTGTPFAVWTNTVPTRIFTKAVD
jgi:pimeloyl-ACP methyl ester carboxylesterase